MPSPGRTDCGPGVGRAPTNHTDTNSWGYTLEPRGLSSMPEPTLGVFASGAEALLSRGAHHHRQLRGGHKLSVCLSPTIKDVARHPFNSTVRGKSLRAKAQSERNRPCTKEIPPCSRFVWFYASCFPKLIGAVMVWVWYAAPLPPAEASAAVTISPDFIRRKPGLCCAADACGHLVGRWRFRRSPMR
jgi:hypothetical protein